MSSYMESAYTIEHRRLQTIVTKCEQELNSAISLLDEKRYSLKKEQDKFQENLQNGQAVSQNIEAELMEQDQIVRQELRNRVEQLYLSCQECPETEMLTHIELIKEYLQDKNVKVSTIESILNQTEERIVKERIQEKNKQSRLLEYDTYSYRTFEMKPKRKKGVNLCEIDKIVDKKNNSVNIKNIFEDKLDKAKKINQIKGEIEKIERKYYEEPEFARELYATQKLNDLEKLIQNQQKEKSSEKKSRHEKNISKYLALKGLLAKGRSDNFNIVEEIDNISDAALELQCEKLEARFIEIKKREYVSSALKKVMEKHGIPFFDEKHMREKYEQYDENIDFNVSGLTQNKLVIEVEGKYTGNSPTLNEKRKSVLSARKVCGIFKEIHEELKKDYGIVFDDINVIEPSEQTIIMKPISDTKSGNNSYMYDKQKLIQHE